MSPIVCLVLVALGFTSVHGNTGSGGWVKVGGRFLRYFAAERNFKDASAVCDKLGGVIVYPDNPAVASYLERKGGVQWIGATDNGHEGKWTWTNGASIAKTNWHKGEPNNGGVARIFGGKQNCAVANYVKGTWDDQQCTRKRPFHCQVIRPGYKYGAGRGLKVHNKKMSWREAAKTCHLEGAELVKVDNAEVNAWLAKQDSKLGRLWIGASDQGHEGKFTLSDGLPAPKDFWYPKEPNNGGGNQNCAVVNFEIPGKWDDQNCNVKNAFVCQIEDSCH